ncbi:Imm50 family immunity protein [Nocardia sp. NPDC059177]|uniref:Imm50 family immunity protein n=1 Tax=Nocardia sp. NPDC059177 TaxID=3346759 RepID=UPI0036C64C5D
MTWVDLLNNARGMYAIFRDDVPSLQAVTIHSVGMHRDGPTLKLVFDLPDFPTDPPKKWRGYKVIRIELWFTGVNSAVIALDTVTKLVDLNISRVIANNQESIRLVATLANTIKIETVASGAQLQRISAY